MKIKEQTILGIEASGFSVSVGVMEAGIARGLYYFNDGSPGSEILLATIDQLLATLKLDKKSLQGICVTLGPGSFTSLRISLAVAESLGLGLNIPVYGVNTLQLIAATLPYYPHPIKVIQNAYKGEFYTATYTTSEGTPAEVSPLSLIKPDILFQDLQENEMLLGTGIEQLLKKDFDLNSKGVRYRQDFHRIVSGIAVIEHFLDEEEKEPSVKPLEPIYIRLSDAEINYKRQFGVEK